MAWRSGLKSAAVARHSLSFHAPSSSSRAGRIWGGDRKRDNGGIRYCADRHGRWLVSVPNTGLHLLQNLDLQARWRVCTTAMLPQQTVGWTEYSTATASMLRCRIVNQAVLVSCPRQAAAGGANWPLAVGRNGRHGLRALVASRMRVISLDRRRCGPPAGGLSSTKYATFVEGGPRKRAGAGSAHQVRLRGGREEWEGGGITSRFE